jgi:hypothetical protein
LKTFVDIPFQNLGLGDFIPMRPTNMELYLVWMERTKNEVVKDEQSAYFKHVHIQWCVPKKQGMREICIKIVG